MNHPIIFKRELMKVIQILNASVIAYAYKPLYTVIVIISSTKLTSELLRACELQMLCLIYSEIIRI